jgi:CheY-like chemotaxis protein
MSETTPKRLETLIQSLAVLIVEDNPHMRKVIRNLLINIGIKQIIEASDGIEGLEAMRTAAPDVVLLDWEMPLLSGAELVRIVRSPGVFPTPDLPIIVLSAHAERRRVVEARRLGVNEYLIKPVSARTLHERLVTLVANPRPIVQRHGYYGPEPRRLLPEDLGPQGAPASQSQSRP